MRALKARIFDYFIAKKGIPESLEFIVSPENQNFQPCCPSVVFSDDDSLDQPSYQTKSFDKTHGSWNECGKLNVINNFREKYFR